MIRQLFEGDFGLSKVENLLEKKNMFVWVQKKHWFTVDSMKVNF